MNNCVKDEQAMAEQSVIGAQLAERPEEVAAGWHPEGKWAADAETILVVEDQAFVRDVTCEVLRASGYRVLQARDAAEAARAYDQNFGDVNLLLTDIVLPGENGSELAERLRRENPSLKVLLITGYPAQMSRQEVESEECLGKPFSTTVLLRKVRQLLDREEPWGQRRKGAKPA